MKNVISELMYQIPGMAIPIQAKYQNSFMHLKHDVAGYKQHESVTSELIHNALDLKLKKFIQKN